MDERCNAIFQDWIRKLDKEMDEAGRKIAMIIDNCPCHPRIESLTAITLYFLPPNTTSRIQPLDMGVIRAFKAHYRKQKARRQLEAAENGGNLNVDVLLAMRLIEKAWSFVTEESIINCFRKAWISKETEQSEVAEEDGDDGEGAEVWEALVQLGQVTGTFEEYQNLDEHLVHRSNEEGESSSQVEEEEEESQEIEEEAALNRIPKKAAKYHKALQKLLEIQILLRSEETMAESIPLAEMLEDVLLSGYASHNFSSF